MVWYNRGKFIIFDRTAAGVGEPPLDLLLDMVKIALMLEAYVINIDTHEDFADIVVSEISNSSVTNYTARGNGIELASKAIARDDAADQSEFDADDLVYTAIGNGTNATFDQLVVMREQDAGATDANTELLAHATVSATTTNGGNVTLVFNTDGLLTLTA
jgi:hypothetical protein